MEGHLNLRLQSLAILNVGNLIIFFFAARYDPKRSCYVPHPEEKFMEGLIQETNGGKVKVQLLNGETHEFKQELVTQVFQHRQITS